MLARPLVHASVSGCPEHERPAPSVLQRARKTTVFEALLRLRPNRDQRKRDYNRRFQKELHQPGGELTSALHVNYLCASPQPGLTFATSVQSPGWAVHVHPPHPHLGPSASFPLLFFFMFAPLSIPGGSRVVIRSFHTTHDIYLQYPFFQLYLTSPK
jgi:hypothetical protein